MYVSFHSEFRKTSVGYIFRLSEMGNEEQPSFLTTFVFHCRIKRFVSFVSLHVSSRFKMASVSGRFIPCLSQVGKEDLLSFANLLPRCRTRKVMFCFAHTPASSPSHFVISFGPRRCSCFIFLLQGKSCCRACIVNRKKNALMPFFFFF